MLQSVVKWVAVATLLAGWLQAEKTAETENNPAALDRLKEVPCVSKTSSCPLELYPLPPDFTKLLQESQKLFEAGQYTDARTKLEAILRVQPDNKIVLYNIALCYLKAGNREKALIYERACRPGTAHPAQKQLLDALEYDILYGGGKRDQTPLSFDEVLGEATAGKSTGGSRTVQRNPVSRADEEIRIVCATLARKDQRQLADSPSGLFNMAQCAEYEGRLDDARRLYDQYLMLVPEALDRDSVALRLREITTFAEDGPNDSTLRKTYISGVRGLMTGAFATASAAFAQLAAGGRGGQAGLLQVGLLSLLSGQRIQARQYLADFLTRESNTDMRDYVTGLLANTERENVTFSEGVDEVLKHIEAFDYTRAAEAIETPLIVYPLSPVANTLAAFVYLNTNNYPAARRAMDILASQQRPVMFYSAVQKPADDRTLLARANIFGDRISFTRSEPGKVLDDGTRVQAQGEAGPPELIDQLPKSEILHIKSTGSAIVIQTSKGEWKLTPQVAFFRPTAGWPARAFMNDYADLIVSYMDVSSVELGDEHTNSRDKWALAGRIAIAGSLAYAQGGQGLGSFGSTTQSVFTALRLASAAFTATQEYRTRQALLNNTINRFFFRPLVTPGAAPAFMLPPSGTATSVASGSQAITGTTGEQIIWQEGTKGQGGFGTVALDPNEIRIRDAKSDRTLSVACPTFAASVASDDFYIETHDGRLRLATALTSSTISGLYSLRLQRPAKRIPIISILFTSRRQREFFRESAERHCNALPARVYSFGSKWSFKGPLKADSAETVPPCEKIRRLKVGVATLPRTYEVVGVLNIETENKDERRVLNADPTGALRIGYRMSQMCSVPLEQQ